LQETQKEGAMMSLANLIRDFSVPSGGLAVFWLGGAAFAFKTASGKIVYLDPYLSDSLDHFYAWKRLPGSPIPFPPSEVDADLVLATHAHEDHLDPHSIPEIAAASEALIAGPALCVQAMREWGIPAERIVEINEGESLTIAGVPITAVFAHHESEAGAPQPDALGYVLDFEGITVYHSGDTLYHPDLKAIRAHEPDIMLVCINGQYGNMTPQEAGRLTREIEPAVVIPMHWGLVAENTADPADFVAAMVSERSRARPVVMSPGDLYVCSC
jgi:L-ascorbate metabolism protein UlaG (beta-lactamase superfamily)